MISWDHKQLHDPESAEFKAFIDMIVAGKPMFSGPKTAKAINDAFIANDMGYRVRGVEEIDEGTVYAVAGTFFPSRAGGDDAI